MTNDTTREALEPLIEQIITARAAYYEATTPAVDALTSIIRIWQESVKTLVTEYRALGLYSEKMTRLQEVCLNHWCVTADVVRGAVIDGNALSAVHECYDQSSGYYGGSDDSTWEVPLTFIEDPEKWMRKQRKSFDKELAKVVDTSRAVERERLELELLDLQERLEALDE